MDEKELLEKLVKLKDDFGDKKIKNSIKNQINVLDSLKGILGASNVERMKLPMEFENRENYMEYIREYIKKHSNDITNFSNRILMLNERITNKWKRRRFNRIIWAINGFRVFSND